MTYRTGLRLILGCGLIGLACTENDANIGMETGGDAGTGDVPSYGGDPPVAGTNGIAGAGRGGATFGGEGGRAARAGAGGAGPTPEGCACPEVPLTWGYDGGLIPLVNKGHLDCTGFRRTTSGVWDTNPLDYECTLPNDHCYPDWEPELASVLALLESQDVKDALSASPVLFGRDARPIDGTVLRLEVGAGVIEIGFPCDDRAGCTPPPADVQALADALQRLERHAALECSPECLPVPPDGDGSCTEPRYYWMYGSCELAPDRSCDTGYATEAECHAAHLQCSNLYRKECAVRGACAEDEYCGYRVVNACGVTDGPAVCLPKPRTCDDTVEPICGCNGETYPSLCEAARAGLGQYALGACE